jgi:hypothetical protein
MSEVGTLEGKTFGRLGRTWEILKLILKKHSGWEWARSIWLKVGQAVMYIVTNFGYNICEFLAWLNNY